MRTIKKISLAIALTSASSLALGMQMLDEEQLSEVSGEGLGTTLENLAIGSKDYADYPDQAFKIKLKLTNNAPNIVDGIDLDNEYLVLSELRLHKSRNSIERRDGEDFDAYMQRVRTTGGFIGTPSNPYIQAQMIELPFAYDNGEPVIALATEWPGKNISQVERSFLRYTATGNITSNGTNTGVYTGVNYGSGFNVGSVGTNTGTSKDGSNLYYSGFPVNFFNKNQSVNIGNMFAKSDEFAAMHLDFENRMDQVSDKFDMHFRIDSLAESNRFKDKEDQLFALVDVIGFRYYNRWEHIWSDPAKGIVSAGAEGLVADELRFTTSSDGSLASQIAFKGVDIFLPGGTYEQPHTSSIVQFEQIKRGRWHIVDSSGAQTEKLSATTQLRTEVAPLQTGQAPQGHIFIQSISMGDPNNPEIITGYDDIYLRDRSGNLVETIEDVKHRAFVPKTVIYNEQVALYNEGKALSEQLPYIPNQNVIEIRGLEIQRQVMTTQDLHR